MATQKITAPSGASVHNVSILPEHTLQFDFDTSAANIGRTDNDLTIHFTNGGQVVIDDFFVTSGADLPPLVLSDGMEISSADLLQSMNPDLDLTTAAGPTAGAQGSGAGDYGDGAGDLLGGVDALGSLGTFQWNRNTEQSDSMEPLGSVGALDAAPSPLHPTTPPVESPVTPPLDPVTPPVNPPIEPEIPVEPPIETFTPKIYRAIAHTISGNRGPNDGPDSPDIRFFIMDEDGNPIDPTTTNVTFQLTSGGPSQYIDFTADPIVHSDGSVSYPILDSYWEEIKEHWQNLWNQGGNTEDWKELMGTIMEEVVVSINGQPSYPMQVIINNQTDYDANDFADTIPAGWELAGEWHSGGSHYEGLDLSSTSGKDALWFESISGGYHEYSFGDGDDTVHLDSLRSSYPRYEEDPDHPNSFYPTDKPSTIFNLGEGNNSFIIGDNTEAPDCIPGIFLSNGGALAVTAEGSGNNSIWLAGIRLDTAAGGVFISTERGDDSVFIQGIRYDSASQTVINLGEGDNSLTFSFFDGGSLSLRNSSTAEILTGSGRDRIEFEDSIMLASGKLSIDTQNGSSDSGNDQDYIRFGGDIQHGGASTIDISTGADTDVIQMDGVLDEFNKFTIDMGDGDDYLFMEGGVTGNWNGMSFLEIKMGEGNDTLVLSADNLDNFIAKYGNWFNGVGSNGTPVNDFKENVTGLENLHVNVGGNQDDAEAIVEQLEEWTKGMDLDITFGVEGENIVTAQDVLNQFGG